MMKLLKLFRLLAFVMRRIESFHKINSMDYLYQQSNYVNCISILIQQERNGRFEEPLPMYHNVIIVWTVIKISRIISLFVIDKTPTSNEATRDYTYQRGTNGKQGNFIAIVRSFYLSASLERICRSICTDWNALRERHLTTKFRCIQECFP